MPTENTLRGLFARFRWLVLAMVVAAALQGLIIGRSYSIHVDGLAFIGIAKDLADQPIETLRRNDQHPGYPALVLATASALRPLLPISEPDLWTLATRVASGTCGVLSVIVFWLFARRLFDELMANIAVLSFAVLPLFRMNAADALSDTQHLLLYLLAVWLAAEGFARERTRWFVAAGAASGAAFWVRPEGLEIAVVTSVLLVWQLIRRQPRAGMALAGLATAVAVTVAPYVLLAGKVTSKQLPFAKRQAVPVFVVEESQIAQREANKAVAVSAAPAAPAGRAVVSSRVAARVAWKALVHFIKNIVWGFRYVFLPLYLIGNWELSRRRLRWWVTALPAGLGALHVAVLFGVFFMSGYIDQRHVMPIVALGLPFAALGTMCVAEKLTALLAPRFSGHAVLAAVTAVSCLVVVPRMLVPMNPELQAVFVAAHWIHEQVHAGEGVVSNSPYVAFYGQMPGVELTPEIPTLDSALLQAPGDTNYEFAVLDLQIQGFRPEWRTQIERDYQEVFRLEDPRSKRDEVKVVVYRTRHKSRSQDGSQPAAVAVPQISAKPRSGRL